MGVGRSIARDFLPHYCCKQSKNVHPTTKSNTAALTLTRCAASFVSCTLTLHAYRHMYHIPQDTRPIDTSRTQHNDGHQQLATPVTPAPPFASLLSILVHILCFPSTSAFPLTIDRYFRRPLPYDLTTRSRDLQRLLGRGQSHDGRATSYPPLAMFINTCRPTTQGMHHIGER